MSRDKQIEEIARELCGEGEYYQDCFHCPTLRCCGTQKFARELYDKGYRKVVEQSETARGRKESIDNGFSPSVTESATRADVAREIFEEIEKKVKASIVIYFEEINKEHIKDTPLYDRCSGIVFALRNAEDFLAELKKKYTEEGK